MRKTMPLTVIAEDFDLTEKTIAWVNEKYPSVDIKGTLDRFTDSALTHGRMYADWQAAFRTWVRKAIENKWDGVEFKAGRKQDPRWQPILEEAKKYGFREPMSHETPGGYKTVFDQWKSAPNRNVGKVLELVKSI